MVWDEGVSQQPAQPRDGGDREGPQLRPCQAAAALARDGVPSRRVWCSLAIAPATRTRSVVKNRALAAEYAGAHRFGVEVFDPATSNTLMAALLVHDLRSTESLARPDAAWSQQAAHGGLWLSTYAPRSVLGVAAALGLVTRG
jgi:hypothetical protein